jgi:oligosaccharide repeat unit polymerase
MIAVIALIILHQLFLLLRFRKFDLFSIYTFLDLVLFNMFFLGVDSDKNLKLSFYENNTLFYGTLLGIIALYLGLHLDYFVRSKTSSYVPKLLFNERRLKSFSVLFILTCILIVFLEYRSTGLSILEFLTAGRIVDYLDKIDAKDSGGAFFYVLVNIFRLPALVYIVILLKRHRYWSALVVYLFLLIGILLIFKTRLEVLITLSLPVAYYHFFVKRISLIKITLFIPFFVVFLTFLDYWRMIGIDDINEVEISIETTSNGFSRDANAIRGFEMLVLKNQNSGLDFEYGANYLYMIATVIPRAIWSDKPLTAFEPRFTKILFNDFSEGVWIFTAWGEGYAQFGFIGILINLFIYGIILNLFISKFSKVNEFKLVYYYNGILLTTFLRGGLQAEIVLFIMLIFSAQMILMKYNNNLR